MIAQVLSRDYVLRQMQDSLGCLEHPPDARPEFARDLAAERFAGAAERLAAATASESESSSASTQDATPRVRGATVQPLDEVAFISHDPIVNLVQSVLEEYFQSQEPERLQKIALPRGQRAGAEDVFVTDVAVAPRKTPSPGHRLAQAFEIPSDPKWVCCKLAEALTRDARHPFVTDPAPAIEIADDACVVLVADWGTGLPRARSVSIQIRRVLDEAGAAGRERHVVHLGDVYYSGWPFEVEQRFLAYWPVLPDEADLIGSFALNGNHEMYSGGEGYFRTLLGDRRFHRQGGASFFKLVNANWQILGLDTAYESHGLADPQPGWLREELAREPTRKGLLLSHHQLFGADGKAAEPLGALVMPLLDGRRVKVWFWGHEHRCVLYEPHLGVPHARCIGHGGVPVYMWRRRNAPYKPPVTYEYREFIRSKTREQWGMLGFAVLDFDGPHIRVRYIDERGTEHQAETIS